MARAKHGQIKNFTHLSQQILDEYQRVSEDLSSKFPSIDIAQIIELITIHGLFIDTQGYTLPVCEGPDDNKFLECAVAGNCEVIISGDYHLLKVSELRGIRRRSRSRRAPSVAASLRRRSCPAG